MSGSNHTCQPSSHSSAKRARFSYEASVLLVLTLGVAFGNTVAASDTSSGLVYGTDFEGVTKLDANHLNMAINHEFNLYTGAAMWTEGLDRQTPGITCHSGVRCVGLEVTDITSSPRNEFNILHLENMVADELFVSVWIYLPPDWSLHNYDAPSQNWNQLINPFFTDAPSFLPYSSMNIIQPDPNNLGFGLQFTYRDIESNWQELATVPSYPLPRGVWFNVQYYVYRAVTDGIVKVWVDGALLFDVENLSTENPSISSWFTTPAKIYYDPTDTFSPYRTWFDDLQVYSSLPNSSLPQTFAVTFYADPGFGTLSVDGAAVADQATGTYSSGQRMHIVAYPASGYSFAGWEASGVSVDDQNAEDTYMTVSGDGSLRADFTAAAQYTITINTLMTDGSRLSGVQVTLGSESVVTDASGIAEFSVSAGTYTLTVQSTVHGMKGTKYIFAQWADGDLQSPKIITVNGPVEYSASYVGSLKVQRRP